MLEPDGFGDQSQMEIQTPMARKMISSIVTSDFASNLRPTDCGQQTGLSVSRRLKCREHRAAIIYKLDPIVMTGHLHVLFPPLTMSGSEVSLIGFIMRSRLTKSQRHKLPKIFEIRRFSSTSEQSTSFASFMYCNKYWYSSTSTHNKSFLETPRLGNNTSWGSGGNTVRTFSIR